MPSITSQKAKKQQQTKTKIFFPPQNDPGCPKLTKDYRWALRNALEFKLAIPHQEPKATHGSCPASSPLLSKALGISTLQLPSYGTAAALPQHGRFLHRWKGYFPFDVVNPLLNSSVDLAASTVGIRPT